MREVEKTNFFIHKMHNKTKMLHSIILLVALLCLHGQPKCNNVAVLLFCFLHFYVFIANMNVIVLLHYSFVFFLFLLYLVENI